MKNEAARPAKSSTAHLKPQQIIIAEDDKMLRELLQIVLREEGFEVVAFPDGRSAIQFLSISRDQGKIPSIIILDLNMPFVDGWGVASWLDADEVLGKIPVIVISATESHGKAAKSLHVDAYLVKPFTTDEILGVVGLFSMLG
jgi:two-component system, OmpR family, phosphate regulon response regulator PhoB